MIQYRTNTITAWPQPGSGYSIRLFFLLLFSVALASCYATTDRLAIYEYAVLNEQEVKPLTGNYHLLEPNGSFSSLTFTARSDPWFYKKEGLLARMGAIPFFPQRPRELPAVDLSFKGVINLEDGGKGLRRIDGVAVFSHVPGTELMLASIPGETLQFYVSDTGEMTPRSEEQKNMNTFFILKQDGKGLAIKLFSETDQGLAEAFDDPSAPLPTDKFLAWLKKNAANAFDEENLPTYLRSTPDQKEQVEKKINAAFAKGGEKKARAKTRARQQAGAGDRNFEVAVSEAAARALRSANGDDAGNADARQRKSQARKRVADRPQGDQDAASGAEAQSEPTRITSIDGYYLVDNQSVVLIKAQNKTDTGVEEIRFYEQLRASPYGLRHIPRNDYVNRGYWYPDSQQFYLQGWFSHGSCGGDWSEINWSSLFEFSKLIVSGKTIKTWRHNVLSLTSIPAGREKKRVCIKRRLDANSCSFIRCLEWSDLRNTTNVYLVRSRDDALLIYNSHFGNR